MSEHVEFYSRNTFEKLVHLVGFIVRISLYTKSGGLQSQSGRFGELKNLLLGDNRNNIPLLPVQEQ